MEAPIQVSQEQMRVAMRSPAHLKSWLEASGRRWLVLNAHHLVDALPWPNGVEALIQIIAAYRDHRALIPTGEVERVQHPKTKELLELQVMHQECLSKTELDRAIRYLVGEITKIDPAWALADQPL